MKTKILYTVIFWHITPLDAFELASPCAQITLFGPTPGQFAGSEVYRVSPEILLLQPETKLLQQPFSKQF